MGVLREKLQSWLTQDPFKRVVLAFCTAQSHDGGPGSVYVLLRKYRKKGRIYWERMARGRGFVLGSADTMPFCPPAACGSRCPKDYRP